MNQKINSKIWDEYKKNLNDLEKKVSNIQNTPSPYSWMSQITKKIKISDLASRNGFDHCPECKEYKVNFDDGRGWFSCQNSGCNFKGNIVDFVDRTGVNL